MVRMTFTDKTITPTITTVSMNYYLGKELKMVPLKLEPTR
jgi:hypothetical protein